MDQEFPEPQQTQTQIPASQALDIYVDDSGSMRGFVSTNGSNYLEVLRTLLLSATTAQLHTSVYPLSSDKAINTMPLSTIQSPAFYSGQDTPLATLLRKIGSRRDHTAILVSDMVLSEPGVDNQGLLTALTDLASQQPEMRLVAFRSGFAGKYFPEAHRGGEPWIPVNVSQSVPSAGRPFYLLVIAPDGPSMTKVEDYLLSHLPVLNTFDPAQPAFRVTGINQTEEKSKHPEWTTASKYVIRSGTGRRFETGFSISPSMSPGEALDLRLTLTLDPVVPIRRAAAVELAGERAVWTGQFDERTTVTVPVNGDLSSDEKTMRPVLTIRKPKRGTWDVYRLMVRPGEGNLDLPAWVRDWSTDDDSSTTDANRTFQLDTLVSAMENVITERELCGEWLLKVNGRGK